MKFELLYLLNQYQCLYVTVERLHRLNMAPNLTLSDDRPHGSQVCAWAHPPLLYSLSCCGWIPTAIAPLQPVSRKALPSLIPFLTTFWAMGNSLTMFRNVQTLKNLRHLFPWIKEVTRCTHKSLTVFLWQENK